MTSHPELPAHTYRRRPRAIGEPRTVFVCHGPSCGERGGPRVLHALREAVQASPLRARVRVCESSCLDHCATGPNAIVQTEDAVRTGLDPAAAEAVVDDLRTRFDVEEERSEDDRRA